MFAFRLWVGGVGQTAPVKLVGISLQKTPQTGWDIERGNCEGLRVRRLVCFTLPAREAGMSAPRYHAKLPVASQYCQCYQETRTSIKGAVPNARDTAGRCLVV
jgi:hypothetical protein